MDYDVIYSICLDEPELYYTECNHGYCITCLSKINKCAICRSPLLRHKLCTEIKRKKTFIELYTLDTPIISSDALRFMWGLGGLAYSN